ncbi:hypothetical protein E4U30_005762 [Claviceps sp. LM220 group G6]|nr:hypothetical protein E4U30_005762 [Claviceps sp. LM220 group G6]
MTQWPDHQEKAWTEFRFMVQVVEKLGAERGRAEERDRRVLETSQQSAILNLKESIEGAVAKALSKTPTTASSWAAIAARVFNAESYYEAVHHKFGHIAAFCAPPREMWPLLR